MDALATQIVGKCKVLLHGDQLKCRFEECNFGNLITDAFVAYHASIYGGSYWTDAPIAIMNGGGIRNSIEMKTSNQISRAELLGALPFRNQVTSEFTSKPKVNPQPCLVIGLSLNGSDLWNTFELAVRSNGETSRGEFLQVSGVQVKYDLNNPVGSRVLEVKVRCGLCSVPTYSPLQKDKTYRLLLTSFLDSGGDGHNFLKEKGFNRMVEDFDEMEVVAWYMTKEGTVYPGEEGRIDVIKSTKGAGSRSVPLLALLVSSMIATLYSR